MIAQAVLLALGVRINMLNFAAVPITIGVGSDYAVNLFAAMDVLKADVRAACAKMGGAILLCSLTTIVGYLSLVIAQSGALRSFGWAAVLGELMAVTAILLVLPAALPLRAAPPDIFCPDIGNRLGTVKHHLALKISAKLRDVLVVDVEHGRPSTRQRFN